MEVTWVGKWESGSLFCSFYNEGNSPPKRGVLFFSSQKGGEGFFLEKPQNFIFSLAGGSLLVLSG